MLRIITPSLLLIVAITQLTRAAGPKFELLAANPLGDPCMATPAISDGMIFLRTQHYLMAAGRKE